MNYSICDENKNILKYAIKNKFVFNGSSLKERKRIFYSVKKKDSAQNLLKEAEKQGFKNCSIIELTNDEIIGEDLLHEKKSAVSKYAKSEKDLEFLKSVFKFDPSEYPDRHPQCIQCERLCKQSIISTIYKCPLFTHRI